jgi:hypothetical protein
VLQCAADSTPVAKEEAGFWNRVCADLSQEGSRTHTVKRRLAQKGAPDL